MKQASWVKPVEGVFESMGHGETLTKFVAIDKGEESGDFSVIIHGFVNSSGELIITHEQVEPIK